MISIDFSSWIITDFKNSYLKLRILTKSLCSSCRELCQECIIWTWRDYRKIFTNLWVTVSSPLPLSELSNTSPMSCNVNDESSWNKLKLLTLSETAFSDVADAILFFFWLSSKWLRRNQTWEKVTQSTGYRRPGKANRKRRIFGFLLSLFPAVACRTTVVKRQLRNEMNCHRFRFILTKQKERIST